MAKANSTTDEELYNGLQQARKKKPRYFALIAKGADVVGLIVQKKVINDGAAQKAKSECKGTLVIQGVCCGEGADLKFEVVGQEPSILPKKIKDFIEEQTDLAVKPYWSVVAQLSAVVDEEAPPGAPPAASGTPPAAPPGPSNQASPPPPPPPPPPPAPPPPKPPVDVKALQARLKTLLTRQRDLFEKNPAFREKFLKFSQPASSLTMSGSPDAPAALDKLEQALDIAERATPQPAQPTPQPAQPAPQSPASAASEPQAAEPKVAEPKASDPMAEWQQKLAAWLPTIRAAIDAKGPEVDKIRKLFAEASALAKAVSLSKPGSDIALAIAKLSECHDLAKASSSPSSAPQAAVDLTAIVADWSREQAKLAAKLTEELKWIKSVVASKDPEFADLQDQLFKAELELQAVLQRSRGAVQSREQAAEMEQYLSDDDVVAAVCEHANFDVQPLLAALQPFKSLAA